MELCDKVGKVIESTPNLISVIIDEDNILEDNKDVLQIGKYLKIREGNSNFVIGTIQNIKLTDGNDESSKYIVQIQPIGALNDEGEFSQGGLRLPSPTEEAYLMKYEELQNIFSKNEQFSFKFGVLSQNKDIDMYIDGNKFFGKHIGIVGSTGSGKSCTVAKILQDVVGINNNCNMHKIEQKNSHIIIFDIHDEYKKAFTLSEDQEFNLNVLNVDTLKLPYWLMNSEELEALFIESGENNSHNQISQFKNAVIKNKIRHNPSLDESRITYDTPVYFDINEVYNYICNMNNEVINKKANEEHLPKLQCGTLITDRIEYFDSKKSFIPYSTAAATKASNGPFNGEFERFISRLETKLNDKRLDFLLKPYKDSSNEEMYKSDDFKEILKQFLGYLNSSNVTIIDLSGIPFEVLSITISLISRLVFDFAFHYSKIKHSIGSKNDIPFMIVYEEAHNYIPKQAGSEYKAAKKSIERIAKEGRKYGLSLMVVSQRPSEVSDTIFSQCNNFAVLRLTNVNDQSYVKHILPNNTSSIADVLPTLSCGECLVVGDSVPLPSIVKLEKPNPEPESESIAFHNEWSKEWNNVNFEDVINRWRREDL